MRYLRLVVGALLVLAAFSGCGAGGWFVVGSGVAAEQAIDLTGFTAVSAGSGFSVDIRKGDSFGVVVRADDNVLPHVRATLEGERLVLALEPGFSYWTTMLQASVTLPELRGVAFSGGVTASVGEGFSTAGTLSVSLSGGSRLATASVACGGLGADLSGGSVLSGAVSCPLGAAELTLSGGSEVRSLTGATLTLDLVHSGGGRSDLSGLSADTAQIELAGGAAATVSVQSSLSATLSGGSFINYRRYEAGPVVTAVEVSGGSSISSY